MRQNAKETRMPERYTVTLFPNGANPDRGKYQEDEKLARIRLLLDAIEDESAELQRYLGPTAWMHWEVDNAVIDCRAELGLTQEGVPAPTAK